MTDKNEFYLTVKFDATDIEFLELHSMFHDSPMKYQNKVEAIRKAIEAGTSEVPMHTIAPEKELELKLRLFNFYLRNNERD